MKIYIIGGGSSGWMTATTMLTKFPEAKITVVESPDVPPVGVGESTTQYFRIWAEYVGLKDEEWMPACDATYKISVRFSGFHDVDDTPWQYPFGTPNINLPHPDVWFWNQYKKGWSNDKFARDYWVSAECAEHNLLPIKHPGFNIKKNTGFHFDAVKFANWLRDNKCQNVNRIIGRVDDFERIGDDIKYLWIDEKQHEADLYFDCTGFTSLLNNSEWLDYSDWLPNDTAWVTRLDYKNDILKKDMLKSYTQCTALSSGWVWTVPTFARIGTGYVFSSKFQDHQSALTEFSRFLKYDTDGFRKIHFKTGRKKEIWCGNVVSIGLSGGFIEPLESNGLLSVHEFLMKFCRMWKPNTTQMMRDTYNKAVSFAFDGFASFVAIHYALTQRRDSPYWRHVSSIRYPDEGMIQAAKITMLEESHNFASKLDWRNAAGDSLFCVMAGHGWNPFNDVIESEILFHGGIPDDSHLNSWTHEWNHGRLGVNPLEYYNRTLYAV